MLRLFISILIFITSFSGVKGQSGTIEVGIETILHRSRFFDPSISYGASISFQHKFNKIIEVQAGISSVEISRLSGIRCKECNMSSQHSQSLAGLNFALSFYLYKNKDHGLLKDLRLNTGLDIMKEYASYYSVTRNDPGRVVTSVVSSNNVHPENLHFLNASIRATLDIKNSLYFVGIMHRNQLISYNDRRFAPSTLVSIQIGKVFDLYDLYWTRVMAFPFRPARPVRPILWM